MPEPGGHVSFYSESTYNIITCHNYCVSVNTISTIKHFDLHRKPSSTQFYFIFILLKFCRSTNQCRHAFKKRK